MKENNHVCIFAIWENTIFFLNYYLNERATKMEQYLTTS